jgi:hypothetical protein
MPDSGQGHASNSGTHLIENLLFIFAEFIFALFELPVKGAMDVASRWTVQGGSNGSSRKKSAGCRRPAA